MSIKRISIHNSSIHQTPASSYSPKNTPSCFTIRKNCISWVAYHFKKIHLTLDCTSLCFHGLLCLIEISTSYAAENPIFKANRYFLHHPAEAILLLLPTQQKIDLDNALWSSIDISLHVCKITSNFKRNSVCSQSFSSNIWELLQTRQQILNGIQGTHTLPFHFDVIWSIHRTRHQPPSAKYQPPKIISCQKWPLSKLKIWKEK